MPSTFSVHDFHSYGFHGTGIIPGLHFHLAASINAETGYYLYHLIYKYIFHYKLQFAPYFKATTFRHKYYKYYNCIILFHIFIDIPLVPSLSSTDPETEPNFVLHWLNNKEMHFSLQAEAILNVNFL